MSQQHRCSKHIISVSVKGVDPDTLAHKISTKMMQGKNIKNKIERIERDEESSGYQEKTISHMDMTTEPSGLLSKLKAIFWRLPVLRVIHGLSLEMHKLEHLLSDTREEMALSRQEMLFRFSDLYSTINARCPRKTTSASSTSDDSIKSKGLPEQFTFNHQEQFRGSQGQVKKRMQKYLSDIEPTLSQFDIKNRCLCADLGCGRGDWLELLKDTDIKAVGIDSNGISCSKAIEKGINIIQTDIFQWLNSKPDQSLALITAFQVVEHLSPDLLLELFSQCFRVLMPGGSILFETPNPENILVSSYYFHMDPTHVRPIPPPLLHFYATETGFTNLKTLRDQEESRSIPNTDQSTARWFTAPMDYAMLAHKPEHT